MNGAESLVHTLLANGVDTCFTNPGTSEMHFVAALDHIAGMRSVLVLQEGVATGAADGYYRMAGKPASTLLPQARYLRAKVEEGSGNLRAAAEIHRGEAERLTGFLRKEEVAKVYLELADKAEQKEPKEFARVVQFCDLALDLGIEMETRVQG